MDFNDSNEQAEFRAKARAWLESNVDKSAVFDRSMSSQESLEAVEEAHQWQAKIYDAGWACITWPKEYGGRGGTPIERIIWSQEVAKYPVRDNFFVIGINHCGSAIQLFASEQQKKTLLPRMARADDVWCQLFSEPSAGSDLAGLKTRAVKQEDNWVINGQKVWTSQAHYSDYGVLLTRTDSSLPKHKGLTMFFIDMKAPGVQVTPIKQADGGAAFNEVFFTDLVIPDSQRLGEVNGGWKVALAVLMHERMGAAEGVLNGWEQFWEMICSLEIDGKPALDDSEVRRKTAEWYTVNAGLKNMAARMLTSIAKGGVPGAEASIGKLVAGKMCQDTSTYALDLMAQGGACVDESSAVMSAFFQQTYLFSPGIRVAGGTDEIMRNIVAEQVLGLPADIRVDKNLPFNEVKSGNQ